MLRATFYSSVLHVLVVVLAVFGLPQDQKEMPDLPEIPISILTVDQFTALSRPKPEAKPETPKPPVKPPPKRPTPEPPTIEPLKTAPPKPPPVKTPEEKAPEAKTPPPKIEPAKIEPAKIEKAAPTLRPETRPPPQPPQERVEKVPDPEKAAETKKPKPDFLTSVLKTLEERRQQPPLQSQDTDKPPEKEPLQPTQTASTQPMTISELDVVRRQFIACWNVPVGARAADNLSVQVRVHVNSDGMVYESYLLEPQRAQADSFYRAAAESALRAVRNPRCNPLKLPADKYDRWKVMTLNFDPKEMFD